MRLWQVAQLTFFPPEWWFPSRPTSITFAWPYSGQLAALHFATICIHFTLVPSFRHGVYVARMLRKPECLDEAPNNPPIAGFKAFTLQKQFETFVVMLDPELHLVPEDELFRRGF
jgi:hypothetical protein